MKAFEKPLSELEEQEMIKRSQAGDLEARNILVEKNMRLVAHMVKKYASTERDMDDLISVGTIGLIKAVDSFKTDKKIRLATYAAKCIDNELLMMLRQDRKKEKEVSMYEPIGKDKEGNEISLIEVVGRENEDSVENFMFEERVRYIYNNVDKVLKPREKEIIGRRFGLWGMKEQTQSELAMKMGISRSYVSRIEKKALDKLHGLLEKGGLL